MEELLKRYTAETLLGGSLQNLQDLPIEGQFEEGNSRACQKLMKSQALVLIKRERGIEFITGLDTEEQLAFGLSHNNLKETTLLPIYKERSVERSTFRIVGLAFLFALAARLLNMGNLLFGGELLLGTILSFLLEGNRKQKRQAVLFRFRENEQEMYLRLSFKSDPKTKEFLEGLQ